MEPFARADEVTVTAEDGAVTRTGTADTWAEYQAAEEDAREGGALSVANDLEDELGPGDDGFSS